MMVFWKMLGGALAALFVLVALSGCEQPRPIPPGTDRVYYGHLVEGEKYGVPVGMAYEEAVATLVGQGLRDAGTSQCTGYYPQDLAQCAEGDDLHIFRRRDFLKDGMLFLRIENGRVAAIFWSYVVVYIDF